MTEKRQLDADIEIARNLARGRLSRGDRFSVG